MKSKRFKRIIASSMIVILCASHNTGLAADQNIGGIVERIEERVNGSELISETELDVEDDEEETKENSGVLSEDQESEFVKDI